jgi:hypothetical protein
MKGAWKERSIATCEERGIPQFADGLKPVQRFLLCHIPLKVAVFLQINGTNPGAGLFKLFADTLADTLCTAGDYHHFILKIEHK